MKIIPVIMLGLMIISSGCASGSQNSMSGAASFMANDDMVGPLGGLTYRANVNGADMPGVNRADTPVWTPVQQNTTSIQAFSGTVDFTYRGYIEIVAGDTRSDIISLSGHNMPALWDAIKVEYRVVGLPDGIIFKNGIRAHEKTGASADNPSSITVFDVFVDSRVAPGVYDYTIDLEYEGTQFGSITGTIKVFPIGAEIGTGGSVTPADSIHLYGPAVLPDGTVLVSQLYKDNKAIRWWPDDQQIVVNRGKWSITVPLGIKGTPAYLGEGYYRLSIRHPDNPVVIGGVAFHMVVSPHP